MQAKLRDGASINRSLLALANVINALGKQSSSGGAAVGGLTHGQAYIPYRNSKLTRLLKEGLSGNSRTVMLATVSCSSDQYLHSTNTLKYAGARPRRHCARARSPKHSPCARADRAKEIKTHVSANVGSVDSHVASYQAIIDNLQGEVAGH